MVRLRNKKPQNDAVVIVENQSIFQKVPIYAWIFVISIVFITGVSILFYFLLKTDDSSNVPNPTRLPTRSPLTIVPTIPIPTGISIPSWINNGYTMPYTSKTSIVNPQAIVAYTMISGDFGLIIAKVNNSSIAGIFEYTLDYTLPHSSYFYRGGIYGDSSIFNYDAELGINTKSLSTSGNTTYYKIIMLARNIDYTFIQSAINPINVYTGSYGDFGIFMGVCKPAIGNDYACLYFFEYLSTAPTIQLIEGSGSMIECNFSVNTLTALPLNYTKSFKYCYKLFGNINNIATKTIITPSSPLNLYNINSGDCGFIFAMTSAGIGLAFFEWTGNVTGTGINNILAPKLVTEPPVITFSIQSNSIQATSVVGGNIKYCVVLI